jgi:hypothetical protein
MAQMAKAAMSEFQLRQGAQAVVVTFQSMLVKVPMVAVSRCERAPLVSKSAVVPQQLRQALVQFH